MNSFFALVRRIAISITLAAAMLVGLVMAGVVKIDTGNARLDFVAKIKSYFNDHEERGEVKRAIVTTGPKVRDIIFTDSFVCQIRSQRHIEVRALEGGYLNGILITEGQAVKKGDTMFEILPVLYQAKLDAENAKAEVAKLKYKYTQQLLEKKVVSENETLLQKAEFAEAQAKANLAQAELNFTHVKAPYDGMVDRLLQREGSLIKEGDILTTLADNSVMWVYFNVPEKYYLRYMAEKARREKEDKIELVLADGSTFPQPGKITIEADFNNQTGNIKFRADFANPDGLLRHGQTGTIKIRRPLKNALLIPQRATFDLLDKRYVWIVDKDGVVHQQPIAVQYELEDVYVIEGGIDVDAKIVLDGVREVEAGEKIEAEFRSPDEAFKKLKFHAE